MLKSFYTSQYVNIGWFFFLYNQCINYRYMDKFDLMSDEELKEYFEDLEADRIISEQQSYE